MDGFKQLVDETSNIKNELVRCHTDLKNNLIDKGVEVTDSDKMSNLIGKIGTIELGRKLARGSTSHSRQVVGLSFRPSLVVFSIQGITNSKFLVGVCSNVSNFAVEYSIDSYNPSDYNSITGMPRKNLVTITDDGFIIDVSPLITSQPVESFISSFNWVAYE